MTTHVLIISHEAPGLQMSGPAIRYWHLAKTLAREFSVVLAVPGEPPVSGDGFIVQGYRRQDGYPLLALTAEADVILVAGFSLYRYPLLKEVDKPLVVDLYDPFILENLIIHQDKPLKSQAEIHAVNLAVLNDQLQVGDFFLCAHESQRDFWLGMLAANGRINPYTVTNDPALERLIAIVPFGLPDEPPIHKHQVLKGIYPGIDPEAKVIYWGGGLWEWFDPLTAIRAVAEVAQVYPQVRLFFAGTKHPNPDVPSMRICDAARHLSDALGLTNQVVFFNEWVEYGERENYLLEADIGISLHFNHIETRFSFRTRLLDYIWAGLPMIVTRGDAISQLVAKYNLGLVVDPGDIKGVRDAILELLQQPHFREQAASRFAAARAGLTWREAASPLLAFCRQPYRAADKCSLPQAEKSGAGHQYPLIIRAWQIYRHEGIMRLLNAIKDYLYWRATTHG